MFKSQFNKTGYFEFYYLNVHVLIIHEMGIISYTFKNSSVCITYKINDM